MQTALGNSDSSSALGRALSTEAVANEAQESGARSGYGRVGPVCPGLAASSRTEDVCRDVNCAPATALAGMPRPRYAALPPSDGAAE